MNNSQYHLQGLAEVVSRLLLKRIEIFRDGVDMQEDLHCQYFSGLYTAIIWHLFPNFDGTNNNILYIIAPYLKPPPKGWTNYISLALTIELTLDNATPIFFIEPKPLHSYMDPSSRALADAETRA